MIPQSRYEVVPVYFKAKLVEGFHDKYLDYLMELDGYSRQKLYQQGVSSVAARWQKRSDIGCLELYMYPESDLINHTYSVQTQKLLEPEADFFEREDDDWVIPRHLFEPI